MDRTHTVYCSCYGVLINPNSKTVEVVVDLNS